MSTELDQINLVFNIIKCDKGPNEYSGLITLYPLKSKDKDSKRKSKFTFHCKFSDYTVHTVSFIKSPNIQKWCELLREPLPLTSERDFQNNLGIPNGEQGSENSKT